MKLAFREYGAGQPLIILHGLFGQSDNWNSLAKKFAEEHLHVFTIDLRNHGLSPHSEDWDYPVMAEDISQFIHDHALEKPILLGHSMGGKVLLFFELAYPGTLSKLIVADISARYYPPHHQNVIRALQAVDLNLVKSRKEAEEAMSLHLSDFGTKQFLLKNLHWKENGILDWRFNLDVISRKIEYIGTAVPAYQSQTPILVLRGERSDYVSDEDLQDFTQRYVHMQSETISGAGHWLHADKPEAFFGAVMRFIKG
ncbi:MAG TPA: alpha/beta fold hydrolase [Bacteroidia bacterium]|nr:alpha/beta fold hydrolase [Bacteroidia bacterium]